MNHHAKDCLHLVKAAQKSEDAFASVAVFVLLTIRQAFFLMSAQVHDVKTNGAKATALFGWKREGYRYIVENKSVLHRAARACKAGKISLDDYVLQLLSIPGLGIVKASFLAQMTVGDGACLDSHNLKGLGLDVNAFKTPKTLQVATIQRRIAAYRGAWQATGTSSDWWNRWCDHVATLYPHRFPNGAEVSRLHRLALEVF